MKGKQSSALDREIPHVSRRRTEARRKHATGADEDVLGGALLLPSHARGELGELQQKELDVPE
jgi:hypothetical protein